MWQLTERNWEYGKEFQMVFIDCNTASDNVRREEIWKSLEKMGILRKVENAYMRTKLH
jgi:hypothetical protein